MWWIKFKKFIIFMVYTFNINYAIKSQNINLSSIFQSLFFLILSNTLIYHIQIIKFINARGNSIPIIITFDTTGMITRVMTTQINCMLWTIARSSDWRKMATDPWILTVMMLWVFKRICTVWFRKKLNY